MLHTRLPVDGVQCNGSWLPQLPRDDYLLVVPVEVHGADDIQSTVRVEQSLDVAVHSQAVHHRPWSRDITPRT